MTLDPVLVIEEVSVRYPRSEHDAIRKISLAVGPGERVALVGPNGSGKTTLLHAVVGLLPSCGRIEVEGVHVEREGLDAVRRRVGFLFAVADDQILFPRVLDDVMFSLRQSGIGREEAAERAGHMLRRLGIEDLAGRSPHQLSLGQRKRVALAGTMVTEPPLLLLDEPSGGLDPGGKCELAAVLSDLPGGALVASHDLEFVCRICSRVLLLEKGRLVGNQPIGEDPDDRRALVRQMLAWMCHSLPYDR